MKVGKVFLIGAGPGDPGLLTVKGRKLLAQADVVVYDALVNPEILKASKRGAKKIYAGKRGSPSQAAAGRIDQDQINQLMLRHAKAGKAVARLKGGDPFLFGRGGEEAEFLADHGIAFEVVPGVSSLTAAPAYAGIPVTDRRHNSILTVVTGHSREDTYGGPGLDWKNVSKTGTLVVLMGVEQMKNIVEKLKEGGWPGKTPVACVRWGTWAKQQVVTGALDDIIAKIETAKPAFSSPAVIVVGSVVNLRKKIRWFDRTGP